MAILPIMILMSLSAVLLSLLIFSFLLPVLGWLQGGCKVAKDAKHLPAAVDICTLSILRSIVDHTTICRSLLIVIVHGAPPKVARKNLHQQL